MNNNITKILITRPKMVGDEATNHTYYWANSIIKKAKSLGYNVFDYKRSSVTYDKINEALKYHNPDIYIHFGHGCPNSLIGQESCMIVNDKNIYDDCSLYCNNISNVKLLKNKIVIAYACHSAKELGKCAMNYGAKAYIGFDDYLVFMIDNKKSEQIFTEPLLEFTNSVLDGDTLGVAKEKADMIFNEKIMIYKDVKYLSKLLMWNKLSFKLLGDSNISVNNLI